MTYRVVNDINVVEKDTDLVIRACKNEQEARELCRSLNLGAGFDGWTPMFFLETFKQKERPSR